MSDFDEMMRRAHERARISHERAERDPEYAAQLQREMLKFISINALEITGYILNKKFDALLGATPVRRLVVDNTPTAAMLPVDLFDESMMEEAWQRAMEHNPEVDPVSSQQIVLVSRD